MSDWKALKERRAAQQTTRIAPKSDALAGAAQVTSAEGPAAPPTPAPEPPVASSSKLAHYGDLPSSLQVREAAGRGRGVFAKSTITPGTTVISTAPLVSVLDNRTLFSRCSACFIAEEDLPPGKVLSQCSRCHALRYCSSACQNRDWVSHRSECKALFAFSQAKSSAKGDGPVPDTPIRALGRLLWAMEKQEDDFRREVNSLQSHRSELSSEQQEQFFQLSVTLASYVGQETLRSSCPSAASLIELCSRFTSNSFSLTSPHLSNIGVSISPLVALLNHSCTPSAVVVFPSYHTPANPKPMRVVAIRPIAAGEEILTSYVDLGLPLRKRRAELRERYYFECDCALCMRRREEWVDPREAFKCVKKDCSGLVRMPDVELQTGDVEDGCSKCGSLRQTNVEQLKTTIASAEAELARAESQQYTDITGASQTLLTSYSTISHFSPSSHPSLANLQTFLSTLLHTQSFVPALPVAMTVYNALTTLHPLGHPTRAIALAALGKLRIVGTNEGDEERYWRDEQGLLQTVQVLVQGLKEVEDSFGKGGVLGAELRELIRQTEEGLKMTRMARGLQ